MGQGLYPGRAQWCALILLGGVKHAGGVCQFVGLRAREGRAIYLAVQGIELRAFAMRYIPRPFYVKTLSQLLNCLDWAQTCNPSVLASKSAGITGLHHLTWLRADFPSSWSMDLWTRETSRQGGHQTPESVKSDAQQLQRPPHGLLC